MIIAATVVLVIAVAVIAYTVLTEGKYRVEESLTIAAPREKIFATVVDLRTWPNWSPWLLHEPDCEIKYSDSPPPDAEGGHYVWSGRRAGAGMMEHAIIKEPDGILQRLRFLKPFRTTAAVTWRFVPDGDGTKVTWAMESSMPFLFRLMTPTVKSMISADYILGLRMLERETDPKTCRFSFEFPGVSEVPAMRCAYWSYSGSFKELHPTLADELPKLVEAAKDGDGNVPGPPMGVCLKIDPKKDHVDYEAAVPTTRDSCEGYEIKEYPGSTCNKVTLKGRFEMLAHAWRVAMTNTRMNRYRIDKSKPPFEVYDNDHEKVEPSEALTSIHIPITRT